MNRTVWFKIFKATDSKLVTFLCQVYFSFCFYSSTIYAKNKISRFNISVFSYTPKISVNSHSLNKRYLELSILFVKEEKKTSHGSANGESFTKLFPKAQPVKEKVFAIFKKVYTSLRCTSQDIWDAIVNIVIFWGEMKGKRKEYFLFLKIFFQTFAIPSRLERSKYAASAFFVKVSRKSIDWYSTSKAEGFWHPLPNPNPKSKFKIQNLKW